MNRSMAAKNKKARTMSMLAGKANALNESMAELMWGDWEPLHTKVARDGLAMMIGHAEYMRAWNKRKAVAV